MIKGINKRIDVDSQNLQFDKIRNASDELIYIHLDFEGYEAIFLEKPDENGRMVEIDYFYTRNQLQIAEPIKIHIEKQKTADQVLDVLLDETNQQIDWDLDNNFKPRTSDPIYVPVKLKRLKRA
ncbi:unnamed protein product [Paramecium sonneborni]|uniref:Uncharacterized protein n=1 Tax=Paramecium sonneborni TaxID=65129 RepID=A0A8S1KGD6_9CILI|nr:unnamed protein product [Paramecium sonneborni]